MIRKTFLGVILFLFVFNCSNGAYAATDSLLIKLNLELDSDRQYIRGALDNINKKIEKNFFEKYGVFTISLLALVVNFLAIFISYRHKIKATKFEGANKLKTQWLNESIDLFANIEALFSTLIEKSLKKNPVELGDEHFKEFILSCNKMKSRMDEKLNNLLILALDDFRKQLQNYLLNRKNLSELTESKKLFCAEFKSWLSSEKENLINNIN